MKKEEFEKLQPKIQEYIHYMVDIGMINSKNKEKILDKLSRTIIEKRHSKPDEIYGGKTETEKDNTIKVTILTDVIEKEAKEMNMDLDLLIDINIYHELTHASSILDEELDQKTKTLFSDLEDKENSYPFIFDYGYTIIQEYIAQSISQKLVAEKYKNPNLFPVKHNKFIFNENGYLEEKPAYSYEYNSSLVYYGELENFALKFIQTIYGKTDIERLYEDHFEDKIFDVLSTNFKNRKNGMKNLYDMFGNMANIGIVDYYQQGYLGKVKRKWCNIDFFRNSIKEFNRISDIEIERDMQL